MAFAERQAAQLEELMAQYGTELLRVCYMVLKDAQQAEDTVQETFIKAYKSMAASSLDNPRAWLMKIAINTCKDYLRSAWFRRVDRKVAPEDVPFLTTDSFEYDDTVFEAVMDMPLKFREVILLRYYEGLKIDEIAQALGLTLSGVQSRLNKARKWLQPKLERWYFDE